MKKNFLKLAVLLIVSALTISATACTYRADGSVIQDVKFDVTYENTDGETVEIESTLKLYKTFAPETTEHIISLIKNKFYNDSNIVFDNGGNYLILGSYRLDNGVYTDMISTNTVKGEFKNNGFDNQGKLNTATAGTLVMLRDPDTNIGSAKYDTATATFAIMLSASSNLPTNSYTAFGKIDDESLEKFTEMKEDLFADVDGYTHVRYVGDRDETTDKLIVENGAYKNSYEYYELNGSAYREVNGEKVEFEYAEESDADYDLWEKLSSANAFDNVILPQKPIKVSNFKVK